MGQFHFFSKHPVFIFLVGTHRVSTGHHRKKKKEKENRSRSIMLSKALGAGLSSALCGGPYSSKAPTAKGFYPTQNGLGPLTGPCGGT
jgi:hypothetical protein